jgi:sulfoxide reductase heme-binding subunit YedZ
MKNRYVVVLKVVMWLLCLGPFATLAYKAWITWRSQGEISALGADPLSVITLTTGHWTLILLLATLAVSPLRRLTGWNWLIKLRRPLGLFAFFYGCLHLVTYLWFDKNWAFGDILPDIGKRPFITVGFMAWLLMLPLAITSTVGWIRRLGGKNWSRLHSLIYASAIVGCVHFWWLVKKDLTRPEEYAGVLAVLLGFRIVYYVRNRPKPAPSKQPVTARA